MNDKKADLAGPGISTYEEVEKILPDDYEPLQTPLRRMKAVSAVKQYIEKHLGEELNLTMVQVPLIVDKDSGVNDYLDRDGSRTPIDFQCGLGLDKPIQAQVVQAATKWKRMALKQFDCKVGEGINTDMRAVRKDYFLDHDHSSYVDQWDWEKVITAEDRNLDYLTDTVKKIWKVIRGAGKHAKELFPELQGATSTPTFPRSSSSSTPRRSSSATRICRASSVRPRSSRTIRRSSSTASAGRSPTATRTRCGPRITTTGSPRPCRPTAGPCTASTATSWSGTRSRRRRHELTSMGIRVTKDTMKVQLEMSGQLDFLDLPYHQAILNDEIPLSIGGGIGQARTYMYLLRTAHLGEVTVTVWPKQLKEICAARNIHVLE